MFRTRRDSAERELTMGVSKGRAHGRRLDSGIVRTVTILEPELPRQTQLPEHVGEVGGTPKLAINASSRELEG